MLALTATLLLNISCSKDNGVCKDTEAISIQNLYSVYIFLEDSLQNPVPNQGPITLDIEVRQCDGTVGETQHYKGITDSFGVFSKTVAFILDNTEEQLRFHAYYGEKETEETRWIKYSDLGEPFGQMTIQISLRYPY